jgi:hypothetical protein
MPHSNREFLRAARSLLLLISGPALFFYGTDATGATIVIVPGDPETTGTITVSATAGGTNTVVAIPVDNLNDWASPQQRAAIIASALSNAGLSASTLTARLVQVNFVDSITMSTDTSSGTSLVGLGSQAGQAEASFFFYGALTGTPAMGVEAVYRSSFTTDATQAIANVQFSDLPSGSGIPQLQATMFNLLLAALPPDQQPNLALDPGSNTISFVYPNGVSNPGVSAVSTDITLGSSVSLSIIPEPGVVVLLGSGLAVLVVAAGRKTASRR